MQIRSILGLDLFKKTTTFQYTYGHIRINITLKYFVSDHPNESSRNSIKSQFNDFNKIYF